MKNLFLLILSLFVFSCDSGGSDSTEIEGCTDFNASNFNEGATVDDGSCEYDDSDNDDDDDGDSGGSGSNDEECNWEEVCDWVTNYVPLGSDSYCTNSCVDDGNYCQSTSDCLFDNGFAGSGCNDSATCVLGEWQTEYVCDWEEVCE